MGKVGEAMTDEFFSEQAIVLELESGEALRAFMRPLKVKEIGLSCRITKLQEEHADEAEFMPHLIKLVEGTIDISIDALPMSTLKQIIDIFIDFNFGDVGADKKLNTKTKGRQDAARNNLAKSFDFLIHQGHSFSDILEYTLPQVKLFQDAAIDRLTGVKKSVDPIAALTAAGVKLKG